MSNLVIRKSTLVIMILFSSVVFVEPVRKIFKPTIGMSYVTSFGTFLLILSLVLLFFTPVHLLKSKKRALGYFLPIFLFSVLTISHNLYFKTDFVTGYSVTVLTPLFVAFFLILMIDKNEVNEVLFKITKLFSIYLIINIIYWALFLRTKLDPSSGLSFARMGGTLAPTVLLGYTILLIFPLIFVFFKNSYKKFMIPVIILFVVAAFLTGSRGALWFILLELIIFLLLTKYKNKTLTIFSIILLAFVGLSLLLNKGIGFDRFFMLEHSSRTESWATGLYYWTNLDFIKQLLGTGFGTVYPYQEWVSNGSNVWYNYFYLNGRFSIVHPHNSYVWVLAELGVIGLLLFIQPIIRAGILIIRKCLTIGFSVDDLPFLLVFLNFILVNMLSSALIHTPSVALLWWFLLFLLIEKYKNVIGGKL